MPDFLNDTVQTLGDPLRNMMLALQGNQPAPPATPQGVSGALNETLLKNPNDDPWNSAIKYASGMHDGLGATGSPAAWAMALAGGPRLRQQPYASRGKFDILEGDTGKNVGYIDAQLVDHPKPNTVYVHNIWSNLKSPEGWAFDSGAHSFGLKDTKALVQALQEHYPEAEGIAGVRVSGARYNRNEDGPESSRAYMKLRPTPSGERIEALGNAATRRWQAMVDSRKEIQNDYLDMMRTNR